MKGKMMKIIMETTKEDWSKLIDLLHFFWIHFNKFFYIIKWKFFFIIITLTLLLYNGIQCLFYIQSFFFLLFHFSLLFLLYRHHRRSHRNHIAILLANNFRLNQHHNIEISNFIYQLRLRVETTGSIDLLWGSSKNIM